MLRITARPLTVVEHNDTGAIVSEVARLVVEHAAEVVVVGLPLQASGDYGDQAREVSAFVDRLVTVVHVPVILWDESYSTVDAHARRAVRGVRPGRGTQHVDAEAAAVILESWLEGGDGVSDP